MNKKHLPIRLRIDRLSIRFSKKVLRTIIVLFIANSSLLYAQRADPFRQARLNLVRNYIEAEGIKNPEVLRAMRTVPRHEFMSPGYRKFAYIDSAYSIGYKQTISPPFVVAYMTETIKPQKTDKVLEIGTGSGYQAAILSELVKDVYTIEIIEPLGRSAARRLKKLGYQNVHPKVGDGFKGWPEHAPFDKIIVTCSPENVPQPLVDQLKEGGLMIVPLGERYQQIMHLFQKKNGKLIRTKLISTLFVPMTGISENLRKIKPDPLHPTIHNGNFEIDENHDGKADSWHYQRQTRLIKNEAPEGKNYVTIENSVAGREAKLVQGFAIDGKKIKELKISLSAKITQIRRQNARNYQPGLYIWYYDGGRKLLKHPSQIGPWVGTSQWENVTRTVKVPASAKEAIVGVGLFGATGRLSVDNIRFEPIRK